MRTPVLLLVSVVFAGCSGADEGDGSNADTAIRSASGGSAAAIFEDPEVQRIHDRMMAAMAPDGAWERVRYLQFDWIVDLGEGRTLARSHRWDRWEGDYRVEAPTQDGTLVALFNVNGPEVGRAWIDGRPLSGVEAAEALRRAYGMHVNDSYWFIMPYKWADPGVDTRYLGTETDDEGNSWEVVELSFEDVGLTPENRYHAYVNPETGLMERWDHYRTADADPSPSVWTNWTDFGGVKLAMDRSRIRFEDVVVGGSVPAGAFDPST